MTDDMAGVVGEPKVRPLGQRLALAGGALVVAVGLLVGIGSCAAQQREREERARAELAAALEPREVVYEMTGDGVNFSMTAETPTGAVQATPDLPLQLKSGESYGFSMSPGDFVYISGQAKDFGRSLTCRILVDGEVIAENTSTGRYSVVTCKGTVPAR